MRSSRRSSAGRATACRDNPGAWITTTARNQAIDRVRRAQRLAEKTSILAGLEALRPAPRNRLTRRTPWRSPTTASG